MEKGHETEPPSSVVVDGDVCLVTELETRHGVTLDQLREQQGDSLVEIVEDPPRAKPFVGTSTWRAVVKDNFWKDGIEPSWFCFTD